MLIEEILTEKEIAEYPRLPEYTTLVEMRRQMPFMPSNEPAPNDYFQAQTGVALCYPKFRIFLL